MFGPLSFPSSKQINDFSVKDESVNKTTCILCDKEYELSREKVAFLQHLFTIHNLVIDDVNKIASLEKYVEFWKMRLKNTTLEDVGIELVKFNELIYVIDSFQLNAVFCELSSNEETQPVNVDVYVLSDNLAEDKTLRNELQTKRLEFVLDQQKRERELTNYCRGCLFCQTEIIGSTTDYLDHLTGKHNILIGKPQNLVFVDQLITVIEDKLKKLQCLYCEKIFKDRTALKEHMRKKQHKRINPNNTGYDRFYIVNYLEMGKNWKSLEHSAAHESPDSDESDSDWSDWREEMQIQIVCLFCKISSASWEDTLNHMLVDHDFDYKSCTYNMDFYLQVKLVNYIRRQIHRLSCINCDFTCGAVNDLIQHMTLERHFSLPDQVLWDQPEYFFSTYENDLFLCHIDDKDEDDSGVVNEPSGSQSTSAIQS